MPLAEDLSKFWNETILRRRPDLKQRNVFVNIANQNQNSFFAANIVTTTKYNALTFFPKNLFEQFRRVANFYFLIVLILQYIPAVQAFAPTLAYLPLAVVITASALKEGIEDYNRFRADREMNNSPCLILSPYDTFIEGKWKDIKVGDVISIKKNSPFPADCLLLSSSAGLRCFVETKSLDGETNLKSKICLPETANLNNKVALERAKMAVLGEKPQSDIYSFFGSLMLVSDEGPIERPLSIDQLLLRGTVLKNTDSVLALVLYSAPDSKIILNSGKTPSKRSKIDRKMNNQVYMIIVVLVFVCACCAIADYGWLVRWPSDNLWLVLPGSSSFAAFLSFWTFVIIFSNFLPISIYISFEIVKLLQAIFIMLDEEMYDEETDFNCLPRNWNISDELGQVEYLFTDKTGTLTENRMEFRACHIAGKNYRNETPKVKTISSAMLTLRKTFGDKISPVLPEQHVYDKVLVDDVIREAKNAPEGSLSSKSSPLLLFCEAMSLCHSVQIDEKTLAFSSTSPDELTLANFARDLGFVFHERGQSSITCSRPGQPKEVFSIVVELAFTSERRRMSVIVKRADGSNVLLSKGADSVMLARLKNKDEELEASEEVEKFAREGLRTLCYAYRELSDGDLAVWMARYKKAELSLEGRVEALAKLSDEIEHDLILLGVTALEDRLQDKVPLTISLLRQAGIKVWMLTGDKQETAVSIGLSCKLLTPESRILRIDGKTEKDISKQLKDYISEIDANLLRPPVVKPRWSLQFDSQLFWKETKDFFVPPKVERLTAAMQLSIRQAPTTMVLEGHALSIIMQNPELTRWLSILGCAAISVICCRAAPIQKAQVVEMIKKYKSESVTLAIGDGANDVAMLQRAHVGVGIYGKEGRQAVNSSDYAFSRFKFLQRLILVHGHWNYVRTSHLALMIYYKNMVFVLPLLWFQAFCGASASTFYQFTMNMFYNLLFTSLSPILSAVFDQDVPAEAILKHPELYIGGINHKHFNFRLYWFHFAIAVYQSFVCYFVPYLVFAWSENSNVPSGLSAGYLFEMGTVVFMVVIINVNFYIAVISRTWPWFFQLILWLSFVIFLPFLYILSRFSVASGVPVYLLNIEPDILIQPAFYLCLCLTVPLCQGLPITLRYIRTSFYPTDADIIREIYALRKFDPDRESISDRLTSAWQIVSGQSNTKSKKRMSRKNSAAAADPDLEQVKLNDVPAVVVTDAGPNNAPNSNRRPEQNVEALVIAPSRISDVSSESLTSGSSDLSSTDVNLI